MTTLVSTLTKPDELSHAAFEERWLTEHSPIAMEMPGLRRYVTVVPDDPTESEVDGVAILTFDSRVALERAFKSPQGQRASADVAEFTDAVRRTIGDEVVHVD